MPDPAVAESPLKHIADVLAAVLGLVGVAYVFGAVTLSLRYQALGLYGQATAAEIPREELLRAALATLVIWVPLGAAATLLIVGAVTLGKRWVDPSARSPSGDRPTASAASETLAAEASSPSPAPGVPDDHAATQPRDEVARRPWRWRGDNGRLRLGPLIAAAVVALLALLTFVHRVWPPAALLAAGFLAWATVRFGAWSTRHVLAAAAATVFVMVAYEADRTSYSAVWSCVSLSDGRHPCGLLAAEQPSGVYLVQPAPPQPTKPNVVQSGPPSLCCAGGVRWLLFVPRSRIVDITSHRTIATANPAERRARHRIALMQVISLDLR